MTQVILDYYDKNITQTFSPTPSTEIVPHPIPPENPQLCRHSDDPEVRGVNRRKQCRIGPGESRLVQHDFKIFVDPIPTVIWIP